jgi:hypothetical protein
MRGGFYNLKNLELCGWGNNMKEAKDAPLARLNNYCKEDGDVILNIYKPKLNEVLEKINRQIIEYNLKLQSLKNVHPNILDIYTIHKYTENIKKLNYHCKKTFLMK